ncbi:T9SS type A sorting domain-containing protein [Pontibacter sp. G13]|uniref:DUF7619 domain-containing protein n=1 Tax=Pontibacter sp. G13 TaxID=3074898 RepID=UPI0028897EBD|nr:T9SS type A sorting domain-containing protein [Pontibacter sp. G13]WNJ20967.1 T9SS type A sorting domain-containing protein [Pontibacter sp. G13]
MTLPAYVSASHNLGAEFWYESTSSNTIQVYLRTYWDCLNNNGGLPPSQVNQSPLIQVATNPPLGSCGVPMMVDTTLISYQEITLVCPGGVTSCGSATVNIYGTVELVYRYTVDLSNVNCGLQVSHIQCCQGTTITSGLASTSIHVDILIPNPQSGSPNNSPVPRQPTHVVGCASSGGSYDLSYRDPEGDSLVYFLRDAHTGATTTASYATGYSGLQPLGPDWSVSLDSQTAILEVLPVNGGSQQLAALSMTVLEYRNGSLLSTSNRHIPIQMNDCFSGNQPPSIDGIIPSASQLIGTDTIVFCSKAQGSFDILLSDPDSTDSLTLVESWFNDLPGASISYSGSNPTVATISWTPTIASIGQTIPCYFTAQDDECLFPSVAAGLVYIHVVDNCSESSISHPTCGQADGSIDLTLHLPYSHLIWNTGDTTEDLSDLAPGTYTVHVYEQNGASLLEETYILTEGGIDISSSIMSPSCANADGSISLQVSGGMGSLSYLWSDGSSSPNLTNLTPGGYAVTVTDSMGCTASEYFMVEEAADCQNVISGKVYVDTNGNCSFDQGEPTVPHAIVQLTPSGRTFTDAHGEYQFRVPSGTYLVGLTEMSPYPVQVDSTCMPSGTIGAYFSGVGETTNQVDFPIQVNASPDLWISQNQASTRPGAIQPVYLTAGNTGGSTTQASISWTLNSPHTFAGSIPPPSSIAQNGQTFTWELGPMASFQTHEITVFVSTGTGSMDGDSIFYNAQISTPDAEVNLVNNQYSAQQRIDDNPESNEKVVEEGVGPFGLIHQSEQTLTYGIHFQNETGHTAQTVVIRDTLPSALDLTSILVLGASHPFELSIEGDQVLVCTFSNIDLISITDDSALSSGFIHFSMEHDGALPAGTEIANRASISFDQYTLSTGSTLNTIFTYPTVQLIAMDTMCVAESIWASIDMPGMSPYEFHWHTGEQSTDSVSHSIGVNGSGWYHVEIVDALGIVAEDSIWVEEKELPIAQFSSQQNGWEVFLSDSSLHADQLTWIVDADTFATETLTYTFTSAGTHVIQLIAENECGSDTTTQSIHLDAVSVADLMAVSVNLWPNPMKTHARISFSNPQKATFEFILYDINGQIVQKISDIRKSEIDISRESLPSGIYLYELHGAFSYYGKLIIE